MWSFTAAVCTKKLMNANVAVKYENDKWQVISEGASKASDSFETKEKALERAKEIAENKEVALRIYKKDGQLQDTKKYSK